MNNEWKDEQYLNMMMIDEKLEKFDEFGQI
jgi:hypothetical protein